MHEKKMACSGDTVDVEDVQKALSFQLMNVTTPEVQPKLEQPGANDLPENPCNESDPRSSTDLVYGHTAVMGRRRVMEDAVTVAPPGWLADEYAFFAVYDGHGGAKVAETCSERLHKCLEDKIINARKEKLDEKVKGLEWWKKVMVECFSCMCENFEEEEEGASETEPERMIGSTAVVVLVGKEEMVVANCGDSRAVLCQDGGPVPLSSDHKPDRPDEKERVEAAGGNIVNWNGWRVQGVLATSRALEPEVRVVKRTDSDNFLIMATDGLWDVVSNDIACEVVKKCLDVYTSKSSGASRATAGLAELAIAKGSRDNISIVVVQLN